LRTDLLGVIAGRADQLQQARDVRRTAMVSRWFRLLPSLNHLSMASAKLLAHLAQVLGQVIDDQAVLVGEELRAHLRDLPARHIGVEAVEEGRVDHHLGERRQQVAGLDQRLDALVDVADEDHGRAGVDRLTAPAEGAEAM
jgi:hypothetical protein